MPKFIIARWRGLFLVCALLWIFWTVYAWWSHRWLMMAFVAISFVMLLVGIAFVEMFYQKLFRSYTKDLVDQLDTASRLTLTSLPIGVFLYDEDNKIVWHNTFIQNMFG